MGKLSNQPKIQHFSHLHPLDLTSAAALFAGRPTSSPCAACKQHPTTHIQGGGYAYTCYTCDYSLHVECAELPTLIDHPAHPSHPLRLLPQPAYPEGHFNCDACGGRGTGFSYHCAACDVDLHALCAKMPLEVAHPVHYHKLSLAFFPPYNHKGFSCDICSNLGSNHWLYRCAHCEFDAHIACANNPTLRPPAPSPAIGLPQMTLPHQTPQMVPQIQMSPQYQMANGPMYMNMAQKQQIQPVNGPLHMNMAFQPQPQPVNGPMYMNMAQQQQPQQVNGPMYMNMAQQPQQPQMGNRGGGPMGAQPRQPGLGEQLLQQAMLSMVDGASQQIGQNLVQSFMSSGGGSGGGGGVFDSSSMGGGFDSSSMGSADFSV